MMIRRLLFAVVFFALPQTFFAQHVFFKIQTGPEVKAPISGRLLVFLEDTNKKTETNMAPGADLNINIYDTATVHVAAAEIHSLAPGATLEFDADTLVFPASFASLPAANYRVQAVLDVQHQFNYSGIWPVDWLSDVVTLTNWKPGSTEPLLTLTHHAAENAGRNKWIAENHAAVTPSVARYEEFESPALTHFWGTSTKIRAWVILPPGYRDDASTAYPTVYWTHGFGGDIEGALGYGIMLRKRMLEKKMPPMIWVMLDESCPYGTHEFADSVNNGPYGTALTSEFIPNLEAHYKIDARPTARFVTGHSSGGWASLQLQINYPKLFGGTWSFSPDPADFSAFGLDLDLYAPQANLYRKAGGTPLYGSRAEPGSASPPDTNEAEAKLFAITGDYGDQFTSFEAVFSPRGENGLPAPMFDRVTGAIDPVVTAYWKQHYDLANIVKANWSKLGPDLQGKIHIIVGTADTFYLDLPSRKLDALLQSLHADAKFTYREGRTHFDIYQIDKDPDAMNEVIAAEMWQVARGNQAWK